MSTNLPLDRLRVLELGHIVAGPSAGLLLADLGADVVKIERPGDGDQSRGMPEGTAAQFHFLNRNKRSIAIDLKGSSEGRALFLRLVATADVVIDNFAHGAVEALGLGYDVLARINPRVIYLASISSSRPTTTSGSSSASPPTATGNASARSSGSTICSPTSGWPTTASAWLRGAGCPRGSRRR